MANDFILTNTALLTTFPVCVCISFGQKIYNKYIGRLNDMPTLIFHTAAALQKESVTHVFSFKSKKRFNVAMLHALFCASRAQVPWYMPLVNEMKIYIQNEKKKKKKIAEKQRCLTRTWNGYDLVFFLHTTMYQCSIATACCHQPQPAIYSILQIPHETVWFAYVCAFRKIANKNVEVLTCKVARTLANLYFFINMMFSSLQLHWRESNDRRAYTNGN